MDELRCKLSNRPTINTSKVVVSLLFLASLPGIVAISADRFKAAQMPQQHADVVTCKPIFVVITVTWLFTICAVLSSLCYAFEVIPLYILLPSFPSLF